MSRRGVIFTLAGVGLALLILAGLLLPDGRPFPPAAVPEAPAPQAGPAVAGKGAKPGAGADKLAAGLDPAAAGPVTVTVSLSAPAAKTAVAAEVRALGGTVLRGLDEREGRALRVRLPAGRLPELAAAPEVVYIEPYAPPAPLNDRARDVITAAPVHVPGFLTPAGLAGAGQIVALADSGLDRGSLSDVHPDLASTPGQRPKIVYLNSFAGGDPSDPIGHGTHMAASIAGTGAASGGQYRGVAPEASLFIQSLLNRQGKLDPPADLVALFRPAYEAGARIHVNGWGGRTNAYLGAASQVDRFVRYYPDFLVVFGAGNNGPGPSSLTPEANSKNALVVGASQTPRPAFGPDSRDAAALASFSSRGPTGDGRLKPDLVVPASAVVSAKSSLVEGNFAAHPEYTRMQGTSMAAALAGGAAALVREYLQKHQNTPVPTAALVKALLINGARSLNGPFPSPESGFGLLDLTGTLLALREGTFHWKQGDAVATGEQRPYTFRVTHADAPFRVTLAWTDPPAAPGAAGALVNDLDLRVIAPDGAEYLGNDFAGRGVRDGVNNVEQVLVTDPVPGEYKVIVAGAAVRRAVRDGTARPVQDFALVFGQPPARHVAAAGDENQLVLADGTVLGLSGRTVTSVVNEELAFPRAVAGADAYLLGPKADPAAVFLVAREVPVDGAKCLPAHPDQPLLVRINPALRTGGYYFLSGQPVLLNGQPVGDPAGIPAGAGVRAHLNPSTQVLWRLEADYREVRGVLASFAPGTGRLRLLNRDREYVLGPEAALGLTRTVVGGDRVDLPFGAASAAEPRYLFPGVDVRLVLSPHTNQVNYLVLKQHVVVGTLRQAPGADGALTFTGGRRLTALPGITVERDGRAAGLGALQPGDLVFAVVVPGAERVLGITAYSKVLYGQLVYAGADTLYLSDYRGHLHVLSLTARSRVYRWDLAGDAALLSPGLMVRVTLAPGTREAGRIDVAESARREIQVGSYDRGQGVLRTAAGESYPVAANAAFTKNGLPVPPRDLVPGETVTLTVLTGPSGPVAVRGSARPKPGVAEPALHVEAIVPLSDRYVVSGRTTADRLYAWVGEPAFNRLELGSDGSFYWVVPFGAGTRGQLVAVNGPTGGVAGREVHFPAGPEAALTDLAGSWARADIERLLARGLVRGYPDGTFRPDRPVTRAEFTVLLARLLGLPGAKPPALPFADAAAIPPWAAPRIALAHQRGIINGYADGTFRPAARISRAEAATILARAAAALGLELPAPAAAQTAPYTDWPLIPAWSRDAVVRACAAGLMRGRPADRFAPAADLTRAETAAVLNRLLQKLE
jgi:subtilisin family serine protease